MNKGIKSTHKKFWDVEQGVTYIPWSKVRVEDLESYREGGMLDADTFNPGKSNHTLYLLKSIANSILIFLFHFLLSTAWNIANDLNKMVAANGALESVSVDGVTQVQVMIMQTFNTLILIFFLFIRFNSYCIGGFQIIIEYEWENEAHEQWSLSGLPSYFLSSIKVPTHNLSM